MTSSASPPPRYDVTGAGGSSNSSSNRLDPHSSETSQQQQQHRRMDDDYDYHATASTSPSEAAADGIRQMNLYNKKNDEVQPTRPVASTTEEALMDLAQLEEVQLEAERMKALGNKHMAAQVRLAAN